MLMLHFGNDVMLNISKKFKSSWEVYELITNYEVLSSILRRIISLEFSSGLPLSVFRGFQGLVGFGHVTKHNYICMFM